jgi:hypothetical protein
MQPHLCPECPPPGVELPGAARNPTAQLRVALDELRSAASAVCVRTVRSSDTQLNPPVLRPVGVLLFLMSRRRSMPGRLHRPAGRPRSRTPLLPSWAMGQVSRWKSLLAAGGDVGRELPAESPAAPRSPPWPPRRQLRASACSPLTPARGPKWRAQGPEGTGGHPFRASCGTAADVRDNTLDILRRDDMEPRTRTACPGSLARDGGRHRDGRRLGGQGGGSKVASRGERRQSRRLRQVASRWRSMNPSRSSGEADP